MPHYATLAMMVGVARHGASSSGPDRPDQQGGWSSVSKPMRLTAVPATVSFPQLKVRARRNGRARTQQRATTHEAKGGSATIHPTMR
jgi:hypothetical protein